MTFPHSFAEIFSPGDITFCIFTLREVPGKNMLAEAKKKKYEDENTPPFSQKLAIDGISGGRFK